MKHFLKILGFVLLFFAMLILAAVAAVLVIAAFFSKDPVLAALPKADSKAFYTSGGFQDFTDYAKYHYHGIDRETLLGTGYFTEMSQQDAEEMQDYLDDFEGWVATVGGELQENYDFDRTTVSAGNFLCLKTKEGEPIGTSAYRKFDNYTLYYFDIRSQVLYYFHSNI